MKVVDLHPDELLDKDARGELSESELTRLEAHLARCETCRFERDVRGDFAGELSDEEELSPQALLALTEGMPVPASHDDKIALLPPEPEEPITPEEEALIAKLSLSKRPSKVRRYVRVLLLVAAALMLATGATASGVAARVWSHMSTAFAVEHDDRRRPMTVTLRRPPPATAAGARERCRSSRSPSRPSPSSSCATRRRRPRRLRRWRVIEARRSAALRLGADLTRQPRRSSSKQVRRAAAATTAARSRSTAASRRRSRPLARGALSAYATVGRLLLDRGNPSGALASFDAYQRKGPGPMDEAVHRPGAPPRSSGSAATVRRAPRGVHS